MSEAITYAIPTYPSNGSCLGYDIGFRLDYRAPKQAKELFAEAPEAVTTVETALGVTEKYSSLMQLSELLDLLRGVKPQFRNMEDVLNSIVSMGYVASDCMINAFDIVGSGFCVASDDGQRLNNAIRAALLRGKNACISFKDITNISAAFLDAAFGQLCNGDFSLDDINKRISLIDISPEKKFLAENAIIEANEFSSDPGRLKIAMDSIAAEGELD